MSSPSKSKAFYMAGIAETNCSPSFACVTKDCELSLSNLVLYYFLRLYNQSYYAWLVLSIDLELLVFIFSTELSSSISIREPLSNLLFLFVKGSIVAVSAAITGESSFGGIWGCLSPIEVMFALQTVAKSGVWFLLWIIAGSLLGLCVFISFLLSFNVKSKKLSSWLFAFV